MQAPDPTFASTTDTDEEKAINCAEQFTREEPLKAVSIAFGAGLFLTFLPIGAIVAGFIRLGFILLRPALLILGIVKLCEEVDRRQRK